MKELARQSGCGEDRGRLQGCPPDPGRPGKDLWTRSSDAENESSQDPIQRVMDGLFSV